MKSHPVYPTHVSGLIVHRFSKRWIVAFIAPVAAVLLVVFFASDASAQAGSPASHINAAPPTGSVAPRTGSVAPPTGGFGQAGFLPYGSSFDREVHHSEMNLPANLHRHHHPRNNPDGVAYPYFYPVAVPYTDDATAEQLPDQADDPEAQDAPSDDWGVPSQNQYATPVYNGPMRPYNPEQQDASITETAADPPREAPQVPTTLVFKDGRRLDVENYAIVGQTLYDLTPGHVRKVALASLDLDATEKLNDDRGVVFQLPPSPVGN